MNVSNWNYFQIKLCINLCHLTLCFFFTDESKGQQPLTSAKLAGSAGQPDQGTQSPGTQEVGQWETGQKRSLAQHRDLQVTCPSRYDQALSLLSCSIVSVLPCVETYICLVSTPSNGKVLYSWMYVGTRPFSFEFIKVPFGRWISYHSKIIWSFLEASIKICVPEFIPFYSEINLNCQKLKRSPWIEWTHLNCVFMFNSPWIFYIWRICFCHDRIIVGKIHILTSIYQLTCVYSNLRSSHGQLLFTFFHPISNCWKAPFWQTLHPKWVIFMKYICINILKCRQLK